MTKKTEIGFYVDIHPIGPIHVPIYGIRDLPEEVVARQMRPAMTTGLKQVEIYHYPSESYVWINQVQQRIFLH